MPCLIQIQLLFNLLNHQWYLFDGGDEGCDDAVDDDVLLVTMVMMLMMMMSMAMMVLMMMDIHRQRTHPVMSDSLIPITLM